MPKDSYYLLKKIQYGYQHHLKWIEATATKESLHLCKFLFVEGFFQFYLIYEKKTFLSEKKILKKNILRIYMYKNNFENQDFLKYSNTLLRFKESKLKTKSSEILKPYKKIEFISKPGFKQTINVQKLIKNWSFFCKFLLLTKFGYMFGSTALHHNIGGVLCCKIYF